MLEQFDNEEKSPPDASRKPVISGNGSSFFSAYDPAADVNANLVGTIEWNLNDGTITLAVYPKEAKINGQPVTDKTRIRGHNVLNPLMLVWCPPGQFCMSDSLVVLTQGFFISRTLVTNQVWNYVMEGHSMGNGYQQTPFHAQRPVEGLSWESAMSFCLKCTELLRAKGVLRRTQKITLPTEAQWEYACRAGTQSVWHFGNGESKLQDYAWYRANSSDHSHPVGLKKPNPWGIYDLYGNLAEWCLDDYSPLIESTSSQVDPLYLSEDPLLKVTRGGAYTHLVSECNSASREAILRDNPFSEPTGIRFICQDEAN